MHIRDVLKNAQKSLRLAIRNINNGFVYMSPQDAETLNDTLALLKKQVDSPIEVGDDRSHFVCLCPDCIKPKSEARLAKDGEVLVNSAYRWRPITQDTPRKAKVLLINKDAGVLTTGAIGSWPTWFTHYCELPVFAKEEAHAES